MSSSEHSATDHRELLVWGIVGFLLLAIAIIYGQTLTFDFLHYDDHLYVNRCPAVSGGLSRGGIVWAFTDGPLGEWYPLSMISHMIDCQVFGLNGRMHHLTNVLLHAATAIGLFFVLRDMTGELWPSACVATVFAVHPQHVESVAWIAERRDVLSGLFFVLTLAAYLAYVRHGCTLGRYLLVAAMLSLGLMAKPILVTVPALLLLLDYWPLSRMNRRDAGWLVAEKLPLLVLSVGACAITLLTHTSDPTAVVAPWSTRLAGAVIAPVAYVVQFLWPAGLAIYYPYPDAGYPLWQVVSSAIVLTLITVLATLWRRESPWLLVGWLWFLGMLVPVLGLVQVSTHAMADRYTYLSGIGLSIVVIWGAARLVAFRPAVVAFGSVAFGSVAIALVIVSVRQTSYWHDDLSLWRHALAVTEDNPKTELGLGNALARANDLDEAVEHLQRAAEWPPSQFLLHDLGKALARQGKLDEAATALRQALKIGRDSAEIHTTLGAVLALQGEHDEASQQYFLAIELAPRFALPHFKLGDLLLQDGQLDQAVVHFERAIELDPTQTGPHIGLANAFVQQGKIEPAIIQCLQALKINPNQPAVRARVNQLQAAATAAGQQ